MTRIATTLFFVAQFLAASAMASTACSPQLRADTQDKCLKMSHPTEGSYIKEKVCTWDDSKEDKCECCIVNEDK